ncbi:aldo/keto reductase, partial [Pseudoalteromonas sp. S1941]
AVAKYLEIAKEFNMTAAQLALAWCNQVDGVTSTIIGATTMAQLKENIQAFEQPLCAESLAEIDTVFKAYPAPF